MVCGDTVYTGTRVDVFRTNEGFTKVLDVDSLASSLSPTAIGSNHRPSDNTLSMLYLATYL